MKNLYTSLLMLLAIASTANAQSMYACWVPRSVWHYPDSIIIMGGTPPYTVAQDSVVYHNSYDSPWSPHPYSFYKNHDSSTIYRNVVYFVGDTMFALRPNRVMAWNPSDNLYYDISPGYTSSQRPPTTPLYITDANGDSVIIQEPTYPFAIITHTNETSMGICNGTISAIVSNGITMQWYSPDSTFLGTSNQISNLCFGQYTLIIDSMGCKRKYRDEMTTWYDSTISFNGIDSGAWMNGSNQNLYIRQGNRPAAQEVCLITVDQQNTHNVLVWDKSALDPYVDSIVIYRKIGANFEKIAAKHKDSLSVYEDFLANPNVTGYRYKLLGKNSADSGRFSKYHNTIYLTNNGANFSWTPYQIENETNAVANYNLYRDNNSDGNFVMVAQADGSQLGVTDIDFNLYPNASYYVEAVMTNGNCEATRSITYTGARSNKKVFSSVGIKENTLSNIAIYPNPATNVVNITGITHETIIKVYDVLGNVVLEKPLDGSTKAHHGLAQGDVAIDISMLSKGVYTFSFSVENGAAVNKMVVKE